MLKYKAKQSREERKQAAKNRIKEKVVILAKWESEGMSSNDLKFPIKSKAAFCKWEDPELEETVLIDGKQQIVHGVFCFTEATLDKDYNSSLKERVVELIGKLNARRTRRGQNAEIMRLKAEIKEYKIAIQNITDEFTASRIEFNEGEKKLKYQTQVIERLEARLRNVETFPRGVR